MSPVKIESTEDGSERGFSLTMTVRLVLHITFKQSEQKGLNETIKLTDETAVLTGWLWF